MQLASVRDIRDIREIFNVCNVYFELLKLCKSFEDISSANKILLTFMILYCDLFANIRALSEMLRRIRISFSRTKDACTNKIIKQRSVNLLSFLLQAV
jgi:hypothetical protein